jgi:hypothetical protein
MKTKKNPQVVNYGKIKRDIIMRDTGGDNRFATKSVQMKKLKKEKYKPDYLNGYEG